MESPTNDGSAALKTPDEVSAVNNVATVCFHCQGLLGTIVDVTAQSVDEAVAELVDTAAVAEMERLQGVFNRCDAAGDLRRWQAVRGYRRLKLGTSERGIHAM